MCEYIREKGWSILNAYIRENEEGQWTYTGGMEESVIDYVLGNERMREKVEILESRMDSDH